MIYIIIILLIIIIFILAFVIRNLLLKQENAEDVIIKYEERFKIVNKGLEDIDTKISKIDEKELFKSDDEIGWFFNSVKKLRDELLNYKTNI
jgi:peptidoglycan hydrolase CwlO-like protein